MDYFSGRVHTVVYEDTPNAFYIMKVLLDEVDNPPSVDPIVTVKGHVPGLAMGIGTWFGFEAKWVTHQKYGQQLSIQRAPVLRNGWDPETAERMLIGHGVGEFLTKRIRHHFGDDDFVSALSDVDRLQEVTGVTDISARHLVQRWSSVVAHFKTLEFLSDLGLPKSLVRNVWATFGEDAIEILSHNPWALVQVDGIKFSHTDEVARRLGLDLGCPERIRGAVLYVTKTQQSFGHLFMQTGGLHGQVRVWVPEVTEADIGQALVGLHKEGLLILDKTTRPGTLAIYVPWNYRMESESALLMRERVDSADFGGDQDHTPESYAKALGAVGPVTEKAAQDGAALPAVVRAAVEEWGSQVKVTLSALQKEGVINGLLHPVSVLTGLPGTGKTTSLRAAVSILQDAEVPFLLCAPTGIAAKRLKELTGAEAYTIHRAFSAKGSTDDGRESTYAGIVGNAKEKTGADGAAWDWEFGPECPHPAQVVIVDEASMVDQHLLFRLLSCTASTCRLVFVGDHAQLPSVGPGNVLRDMIGSGQVPVVKLTEIFRQKDTSDIVFAAHAIHRGESPKTDKKSDFALIQVSSEDEVLKYILSIAANLYAKNRERHRSQGTQDTFQILSPRHGGTVGVTNLNAQLRALLNPPSTGLMEMRLGKDTIREEDRVMVVKNDYKRRVFNGDVGKIKRVDRKAKVVEVKVFGNPPLTVQFPFNQVGRYIRLAYACTVHKAQGLEYDIIVMPLVDGFGHQLQRNLLYTAVTRAKKKVLLVGTHTALASAVMNNKEDRRSTLFPDRLEKLFGR